MAGEGIGIGCGIGGDSECGVGGWAVLCNFCIFGPPKMTDKPSASHKHADMEEHTLTLRTLTAGLRARGQEGGALCAEGPCGGRRRGAPKREVPFPLGRVRSPPRPGKRGVLPGSSPAPRAPQTLRHPEAELRWGAPPRTSGDGTRVGGTRGGTTLPLWAWESPENAVGGCGRGSEGISFWGLPAVSAPGFRMLLASSSS